MSKSSIQIFDVTIPLQPGMAVWPGDTPYGYDRILKMEEGSNINLGSVGMSVHAGTHADAPYHFLQEGMTIDQIDPGVYCGSAVVIDVRGREVIQRADVPAVELAKAPRVLFRTDAWTDHTRFPEEIPVMAPDMPGYLKDHGVILVGLDVPSVDAIQSKTLPNHYALAGAGIHILESLSLKDIAPGKYELVALPLRLVGSDAAPVRAILRR